MESVNVKYTGLCPKFKTIWEGKELSLPKGEIVNVPVEWWEKYKGHKQGKGLDEIVDKKTKKNVGKDGDKNE